MRPLLAALLVTLLTVLTLHAADEARPNTLTPQEIADGWLLLFDGETTFGWKIDGESSVKDGFLVLGGGKPTTLAFGTEFSDYELRCEYRQPKNQPRLAVTVRTRLNDVILGDEEGTSEITVQGKQLSWLNAKRNSPLSSKISMTINDKPDKGMPQFRVSNGYQCSLRNIKLRPLGLKPIFNGKDLTGWKEAPNKKSKFTVTDKGVPGATLNIKDGPGDLQTEEQWDDFILQLECQSHGKHLNSGVFFRCIPGQYQNGYEAQIQNGYKDGDRSKPIDFGTGAIYRRVPARKVVANDLEWFTMTVVAQGPHLATWVNGYQTVDWTDERPPDDNPRKGTKTGKGPISLQGHDPTTNLSFRNMRIAELPKK